MAREGLRSHLSGSVPISIAFHLVALVLLLIIPLAAEMILPVPATELPDYIRVAPMPPPPAVRLRTAPRDASTATDRNQPSAPTAAPPSIIPEAASPGPVSDVVLPDFSAGGTPFPGVMTGGGGLVAIQVPEPPRPSGPVRAADLPVSPRKTVDVRPVYPDIARAARVEGTIVMEAVLDTSGRVTQLHVLKSVPLLDQAAIDAVNQWRYTPSVYGGHPVSVLMTITIRFTLQ